MPLAACRVAWASDDSLRSNKSAAFPAHRSAYVCVSATVLFLFFNYSFYGQYNASRRGLSLSFKTSVSLTAFLSFICFLYLHFLKKCRKIQHHRHGRHLLCVFHTFVLCLAARRLSRCLGLRRLAALKQVCGFSCAPLGIFLRVGDGAVFFFNYSFYGQCNASLRK